LPPSKAKGRWLNWHSSSRRPPEPDHQLEGAGRGRHGRFVRRGSGRGGFVNHFDRCKTRCSGLIRETMARCSEVVRSHWGVENRLHWRLDVTMNEDQDRTRLDNGPHNLAVLRHMALNVMQKDTTKGSLRGKFMRAGWDDRYLARLLALF
jgi:hypothetical protein